MIVQLLILAVLVLVIPVIVGGLTAGVDKSLLFRWVSGQFLLWAGFQVICVPMVLTARKFQDVVILFSGYILALVLLAVARVLRRRAKAPRWKKTGDVSLKREGVLLWLIFWLILVFQLVQAVRMTYGDGDDAYYVAVSTITQKSDSMYRILTYTGLASELDVRHALAPFPIWIAYLARISGMRAVMTAHVAVPVVLIPMTYAIYYLIGARLFPDKGGRLPLFLVFTELLILFGNYSISSVENFMIARSRQGKAALGSIVIPFVLLLLLILCEKLRHKQEVSPKFYLLLTAAALVGCLCSTMGALLLCLLVGVTGITAALVNKRYRILFPMAAACVPCVCFAMLYLLLA